MMDMVQEDVIETDNIILSEWQSNGSVLANPMSVSSLLPPTWDKNISLHTDILPNGASSDLLPGSGNIGMFWTQPNAFVPTASRMVPQFPDSESIQRALRLSCFNGGNMPMGPYSRGLMPIQKTMNPYSVAESSKEGSLLLEELKNHKKCEKFFEANDGLGNECEGQECSGHGDQEKESVSKKRKWRGQELQQAELEKNKGIPHISDVTVDRTEIQQDIDQILMSSTSSKHGMDYIKQAGSHASDPSKEEHIHVRARRGQATNSHSLAERVRREKISQRMKFLQDLVPGCNKVTGKAVMLDEIINYVQPLQRQVEFLSMKLATVIPRADFNMDGLLAKDTSQVGRSLLTFPPDVTMHYPASKPPQWEFPQCPPENYQLLKSHHQ
ncbi:unnamed protein product [Cuscuta campestris]|uniref:BHLH domain-containing protein n=1 Tax=Cuscuta campestris TaxID=132261 RepID=A0A484MC17_9ASTE|nr:unnamed protein product [Cuscuta campestris]